MSSDDIWLVCDQCAKTYLDNSEFSEHCKENHNITCASCDMHYVTEAELSEHLATVHGIESESHSTNSSHTISRLGNPSNLDLPSASPTAQVLHHRCVCRICLVESKDYLSCGPCGHLYCSSCLDEWLTNHSTCPTCIATIVPHEIRRVYI